MRVRWTTDAADDLERICDDIAETNPDSARRIAKAIVEGIASRSVAGRMRLSVESAAEGSQLDGTTCYAASSESPTMASLARKAPCVESRSLARVLQGLHGGEVDPLRRHGS